MKKANRNHNFDLLRLVATIMVVFHHSFFLLEPNRLSNSFLGYIFPWSLSQVGLFIFFSLSGYLVTASYFKNPDFYIRNRMLRIAPAYFISIIVTIFLIGALATKLELSEYFTAAETYKYLTNLLFFVWYWDIPGVATNNPVEALNISIWTLAPELILYGLVFIAGKSRDTPKFILFTLCVFLIMVALNLNNTVLNKENYEIRILPEWNLSVFFLIGSCLFLFKDKIKFNTKILVLTFVFSALCFYAELYFIGTYLLLPYLVLYIACNEHIKLPNITKYGDFSYGIYIYSSVIQQVIIAYKPGLNPLILFLESLLISLVLAIISWHLVEKKALKFKRGNSLQ